MDKDLEGLINDDVEEEGSASDSGSEEGDSGEKKRKHDSDLEEDLSDEDYDLIKENLGIEVKRKVKIMAGGSLLFLIIYLMIPTKIPCQFPNQFSLFSF